MAVGALLLLAAFDLRSLGGGGEGDGDGELSESRDRVELAIATDDEQGVWVVVFTNRKRTNWCVRENSN